MRRRGLMVLLALLAIAATVIAVVLVGGSSVDEGPGTSAFDPSVPTSAQRLYNNVMISAGLGFFFPRMKPRLYNF